MVDENNQDSEANLLQIDMNFWHSDINLNITAFLFEQKKSFIKLS